MFSGVAFHFRVLSDYKIKSIQKPSPQQFNRSLSFMNFIGNDHKVLDPTVIETIIYIHVLLKIN